MFGMGTTPPSSENTGDHPTALRSQRSYPGATQVTQTISVTVSNTVPPSPTTIQVDGTNKMTPNLYHNVKIILGTRKLFRNTNTPDTNTIIYCKSATITHSNLLSII